MAPPADNTIYYRRARFTTRLPKDYRYAASHFWLAEAEPALWRVGFTKFATRMLGDIVECNFEAKPGDVVRVGETIGTVEGFKALTDLYCVAQGVFAGANPDLDQDVSLIDSDPYDKGWLYAVRGRPEPNSVDVAGYVQILDATIDKMLAEQRGQGSGTGRRGDDG